MAPLGFQLPIGRERSPGGHQDDHHVCVGSRQSEIPAGQAYQLSIRHPDGSTQQLDISEKNYRDLRLAGWARR